MSLRTLGRALALALFLFSLEDIYGVSERVTGWSPSPDNLFYFEDVRLD